MKRSGIKDIYKLKQNDKICLLFIFSFLLFISQKNLGQQPVANEFKSIKLAKGVPSLLISNGYFYPPDSISYAIIFENENDSLYFIRKKINTDSINYVLVLTSNKKIVGYDHLNLRKINKDSLFGSSNIDLLDKYIIDFYYLPNDNIISSRVIKKKKSPVSFELGIRYETGVMFANYYNHTSSFFDPRSSNYVKTFLPLDLAFGLLNFHLSIGMNVLESYKIYFRFGILSVYDDYIGLDKGIFLEAKLFNSNFYGVLGIDFFDNRGDAHGVQDYSESGGNVTSFCFGFGYQASGHFSIDLMYYLPRNKVYGYDYVSIVHQGPERAFDIITFDKINYGLLILGFQYSFIL